MQGRHAKSKRLTVEGHSKVLVDKHRLVTRLVILDILHPEEQTGSPGILLILGHEVRPLAESLRGPRKSYACPVEVAGFDIRKLVN